MSNSLCLQGSNSDYFIPKQDHSIGICQRKVDCSVLPIEQISQTAADTKDVIASLHDLQRLDFCIDGLLKREKM